MASKCFKKKRIPISLFAGSVLLLAGNFAQAEPQPPRDALTVYACNESGLVQSQITSSNHAATASLIRAGHAVWANGRVDALTIDAMAEGRGIWAATPLTTLAQVADTSIPADVLTAIAIKESGLSNRFWPWTINWNGRSFYLESRETAVDAARYLLSQGIHNFDVALMQVNWRWHKHRFASIESAFDPIVNLKVASEILTENFKATGNWQSAIARYHSRTPSRAQPYLAGVLKHLGTVQKPNIIPPEKKLCSSNS